MVRILIVAGEKDLAWALCRRLSYEHPAARVQYACTIEDAVRRLSEGPLAVLVADVELPGESSLPFVVAARRSSDTLAILLMAFELTPDVRAVAVEARAFEVLQKPFELPRFLASMRCALRPPGIGSAEPLAASRRTSEPLRAWRVGDEIEVLLSSRWEPATVRDLWDDGTVAARLLDGATFFIAPARRDALRARNRP